MKVLQYLSYLFQSAIAELSTKPSLLSSITFFKRKAHTLPTFKGHGVILPFYFHFLNVRVFVLLSK